MMALFDTFKQQIQTLWSRWTNAQRVGISAAAVACVAGVIGTFIWATRADYVVLLNQLSPQRAAEIVAFWKTNNSTPNSTFPVQRSQFLAATSVVLAWH
ncbi:MAG: hypothetical protein GY903_23105 [Fuerstiella sp.]|nr:hypothetical protein [Fuerstiella sp.]